MKQLLDFDVIPCGFAQSGKIWRSERKDMVGREQRKNTSSIPLNQFVDLI